LKGWLVCPYDAPRFDSPSYVQDFLNAFEDMVEYLKGGDQIIAQMEEELRYTLLH
jgi:hypothetical protein